MPCEEALGQLDETAAEARDAARAVYDARRDRLADGDDDVDDSRELSHGWAAIFEVRREDSVEG